MKSWDSIRYYLAVARQGTVSGAATELAVTHATVLRRIDQFEQGLGLKLFRHHSLCYDLTDAGKTLFERLLSIEAGASSHRGLQISNVLRTDLCRVIGKNSVSPLSKQLNCS